MNIMNELNQGFGLQPSLLMAVFFTYIVISFGELAFYGNVSKWNLIYVCYWLSTKIFLLWKK